MDSKTSITEALRQAADLLEQHPQLPQPYLTSLTDGTVELHWYLHHDSDLTEQKATANSIVRAIGGKWDKNPDSALGFAFTGRRGQVRLFVSVDRPAVCERVVVGTEKVTVPAVEAQPERVEEREVVRWECRPLLASDDTPHLMSEAELDNWEQDEAAKDLLYEYLDEYQASEDSRDKPEVSA